ncbi:MAG: hypothetical protein KAU50_00330, partial [Candidatus Marinimicrobia bacterium]|nr:hypothetical protein [Candidatus Neomarinimicrobiota bacterium]
MKEAILDQKRVYLLLITSLAGVLLVYLAYGPALLSRPEVPLPSAEDAPDLGDLPFHQAFVGEETCLTCHTTGRDMPAFDLVSPKMPHEHRRMCVQC